MARIRPSSVSRVIACPGSLALCEGIEESTTIEAEEGTAAHWVFEQMFNAVCPKLNDIAPNGVMITDEMLEGAQLFDYTFNEHCPGQTPSVESFVWAKSLHAECGGTPDLSAYDYATRTLTVFDYKFGHSFVDVVKNWQMLAYAAGLRDNLCAIGALTPLHYRFVIVQPRCYIAKPVRTWSPTLAEVEDLWEEMRETLRVAALPGAPCSTSDECKYCPTRTNCTTLGMAVHELADWAGAPTTFDGSLDNIGKELDMLRKAAALIDARQTGIETCMIAAMKANHNVPGWTLKQGFGRKRWIDESTAIDLAKSLGVDISKPGIVTPPQALKLGVPQFMIDCNTETPLGDLKLEKFNMSGVFNNGN